MSATQNNGIVNLHGRQYKTVALRVQEFREQHPVAEGWGLVTTLIEATPEIVLFRAAVIDPQGREVAVGFAEEVRTNRGINKTSALENCETSALGRALAAAGYGGSEYASADELANAIHQQRNPPQQAGPTVATERQYHASWKTDHTRFLAALEHRGLTHDDTAAYCQKRKWGRPASWTTEERNRFLEDLDGGAFKDLYDPASQQQAS